MSAQPYNPITGEYFANLKNAPDTTALDNEMSVNRYAHNDWATFQQWKKASPPRYVKRGQKGTKLTSSTGFSWYVFNIDQTAHKVEKADNRTTDPTKLALDDGSRPA